MDDDYKHPADERKVRFRPNIVGSRGENSKWIITITLVAFLLSASLQFVSSELFRDKSNVVAVITVFLIVLIGIFFDIIGIAVTAADETPFHAMASRKLFGARRAIKLIRNANKVSSICNDVVGDICGVISGTASALIVVRISQNLNLLETTLAGLSVSGMVAALTVGGKAFGKTYAIGNSNFIVYKVGVVLQFILAKRIFLKGNRKKSNDRK